MRLSAGTLGILLFAASVLPVVASASGPDIHFASDGTMSAKNLTVYQKAGANLFCRATWGQAFIRLVVLVGTSTAITKSHGEPASVQDIHEQDVIDVEGALATGADSIVINAKRIRDGALESAGKTISGPVVRVDTNVNTFVVNDKTLGKVTVTIAGAAITKGARSIALSDIKTGDKILSAEGTYTYTSNTLAATSVVVYQDGSVFLPRNFQGTLKSLSGTTLPITLVVTVGSTDYTVYVPQGASILKNSKASGSLSRFVLGDTVRFYGVIRPTNLTEVDAEVLRDLNF